MPYLRIATGLLSESGREVAAIVRHIPLPNGWDAWTETEREMFANDHIAHLENDCAFSEWDVTT